MAEECVSWSNNPESLLLLLEWSSLFTGLWEKLPCPLSPMAPSEEGTEEDGLLGNAWLSTVFFIETNFYYDIMSNITMYIPVQVFLWMSETIFHQLVGKDQKLWQCTVLAKLSRQTLSYICWQEHKLGLLPWRAIWLNILLIYTYE